MDIGISTLVLCNPKEKHTEGWTEIYDVLRDLDRTGYRFVELATRSLPLSIVKDGEQAGKMRDLLDSLKIRVHQIHISNNPGDIGSSEPNARREAVDWIKKAIDFCRGFTPAYVGIHPGNRTQDVHDPRRGWNAARKSWLIEAVEEIADHSEKSGIKLMLETIGYDLPKLEEIIDSVSRSQVGILVDVAHCHCFLKQDPADVIRKAGDRLYSVHMHDNHGETDEHLVPGDGTIHWESVVKALDEIGYPGVFILECHRSTSSTDPDEISRLAKKNAEKLIAKYYPGGSQ